MSELKDIGELEPQLQFDGVPQTGKSIAAGGVEMGSESPSPNTSGSEGTPGESDSDPISEQLTPTAPPAAPSAAGQGDPDAAPGERAADVNDPEQDTHAVATTTDAFNGNATETQTESDEFDRSEPLK